MGKLIINIAGGEVSCNSLVKKVEINLFKTDEILQSEKIEFDERIIL